MSLVEKIHEDMVGAMKQRAVDRLSTLRMVKAALKNKEIDQRAPVTDAQAVQVLTTLIKQRKDSIEQFTKGNRPELAEKEAAEIVVIEEYMPKAAGDEELRQLVTSTVAELRAAGSCPRAEGYGQRDEGGSGENSGQRRPRRWPVGERNGQIRLGRATSRLSRSVVGQSQTWVTRGSLSRRCRPAALPPGRGPLPLSPSPAA